MKRSGSFWGAAWLLALGLCAMVVPGIAQAQSLDTEADQELSRDWQLRLGTYVLQSETARRKAGNVGISAGAERRVYAGNGYDVNIGVAYNGLNDVYNIPLTVNLVAYKDNIRYGVGGGYSYGKRVNGQGLSAAVLDVVAGYQLTRGRYPLSLDLRYYFVAGANNELDGYSLTLGMRF